LELVSYRRTHTKETGFFEVGLVPEIPLYFPGVKVRKTQPIGGFDVACKCPRKYRGISVKEGWFILTNLGSLNSAIPYGIASLHAAYKKRMGIEESYLDYKSRGYYLEETGLKCKQLMTKNFLMVPAT
jgi:hypothetical protein